MLEGAPAGGSLLRLRAQPPRPPFPALQSSGGFPDDFFDVFFAAFFAPGSEDFLSARSSPPSAGDGPHRRGCRRHGPPRLVGGVEVDPEIFSGAGFSEVVAPFPESSPVPPLLELSEELSDPSPPEPLESAGPDSEPLDRPPTRIAAPVPIRRRSFLRPHSGQVFSGSAVIDWKSSKACPQASQT